MDKKREPVPVFDDGQDAVLTCGDDCQRWAPESTDNPRCPHGTCSGNAHPGSRGNWVLRNDPYATRCLYIVKRQAVGIA